MTLCRPPPPSPTTIIYFLNCSLLLKIPRIAYAISPCNISCQWCCHTTFILDFVVCAQLEGRWSYMKCDHSRQHFVSHRVGGYLPLKVVLNPNPVHPQHRPQTPNNILCLFVLARRCTYPCDSLSTAKVFLSPPNQKMEMMLIYKKKHIVA